MSLADVTHRWIPRQPNGRVTSCDSCHRRVWPDEPRLQVHDGKGRYVNKGTASSYWCKDCAESGGAVPFVPVEQEVFDLE